VERAAAARRQTMVLSVDRKSLNKSVDDLMPQTVEEASRRRSDTNSEQQRILAYLEVLANPPPLVRSGAHQRFGGPLSCCYEASCLWLTPCRS
jgi:hypothetical protein